jgi:hypothetical protein
MPKDEAGEPSEGRSMGDKVGRMDVLLRIRNVRAGYAVLPGARDTAWTMA